MRARITKWMAGLTVIAALAVGGASFASAAGKSSPAPQPPVATVDSGSQQGDQSAPDTATGSESAGEAAGEVSGEASGEATSESVANDGPGGHADEPGNPNADYQFEGEQ